MARNRIVYAVLLLACAAAEIATGAPGPLLMLALLSAAAVCSLIGLLLACVGAKLSFVLPESGTAGHCPPIELVLTRPGFCAFSRIRVLLCRRNRLFDETIRREFFLVPGKGRQERYTLGAIAQDCGFQEVRLEKVRCYDLLGLFFVALTPPEPQTYLLFPPVPALNIGLGEDSTLRSMGEGADVHRAGHDVTEVFDLRDYREGDGPRSIHWKLSAKLDRLIVREFGNPGDERTLLFLDGHFPGWRGARPLAGAVYGMGEAISRGLLALELPHKLSVLCRGEVHSFPVENSEGSLRRLREMMCMPAPAGDEACPDTLEIAPGARLIFVTGKLQEPLFATLSQGCELNVVLLTEGGTEHIEERGSYRILALPRDRLQGQLHRLEL